jgi:hypothetical protein
MSGVLQVSVSFVVCFLVLKYNSQALEMTEIYPMLFLDEYCQVKDEILRIFLGYSIFNALDDDAELL